MVRRSSGWNVSCNSVLMFLSLITIHPLPGDEARVIEVLDSIRCLVATNADCSCCLFAAGAEAGSSICYLERWHNRAALDRHLRSPLYCRVLEAMELSRLPPTVEFYQLTPIGGLDVIENIRLQPLVRDRPAGRATDNK